MYVSLAGIARVAVGVTTSAPLPSSISYFFGWGSLLGFVLVIQVATGVLLATLYVSYQSFTAIEVISCWSRGLATT